MKPSKLLKHISTEIFSPAACTHEWILSIDADERCTPEVRDEILRLLAETPAHEAYLIPRRNYFMGRWIRHSGWYPNYRQPQFFRKGSMSYTPDVVHEGYIVHSGQAPGKLMNDIWQCPFRNLEEVNRKMTRYSTLGAEKLKGRRAASRLQASDSSESVSMLR